ELQPLNCKQQQSWWKGTARSL
ncbi:GDYXXLXY protein, partial [Acinetobacter baumannii]|nr:GDYXXLXY protein [Acinetobacter baumannii]EMB9037325.1 GDYXXLXY protein [Acinetobacter baumannii]